ncbi:MAG TPA: hypothetical protein PLV41_09770, partial [Miltoncostaeales bacterium]|nr:hypothetical protein [Miltoncostaeales bacterium]
GMTGNNQRSGETEIRPFFRDEVVREDLGDHSNPMRLNNDDHPPRFGRADVQAHRRAKQRRPHEDGMAPPSTCDRPGAGLKDRVTLAAKSVDFFDEGPICGESKRPILCQDEARNRLVIDVRDGERCPWIQESRTKAHPGDRRFDKACLDATVMGKSKGITSGLRVVRDDDLHLTDAKAGECHYDTPW